MFLWVRLEQPIFNETVQPTTYSVFLDVLIPNMPLPLAESHCATSTQPEHSKGTVFLSQRDLSFVLRKIRYGKASAGYLEGPPDFDGVFVRR